MTDVRKDDFTLISSPSDVIPLYQGNGLPLDRQTLGLETEIYLYKKGPDGAAVAASPADCTALIDLLKQRGHSPQLEMASAVEYASPPCRVDQTASLVREIASSWQDYQQAIRDQGLFANDAALLPFATVASAKENLVDRDRARGLVKGMGLFKAEEFLKVTLLCTSTQVSVSFANADDLYNTLNTAYALGPVVYGVFGNYPAYIEGSDKRVDFNPRAKFYEAFGKDGGIPDSVLYAKDGQDLIRRHVDQVFTNELLFYYDQDQNIVWTEKPVRFTDLIALGLNTRSNYDLAESFVYTDLKICNIRDENGVATGKRIEVRGFDAGALGLHGSLPFIHAVLRDEETRDHVNGLLLAYGFSPELPKWKERLLEARHAVADHGGKYLDVPFGNGNLKLFCRQLGEILELYAQKNPELAPYLAPVTDICRSGISVAEQKAKNTVDYAAACRILPEQTQEQHSVKPARNLRF